VGNLNTEARRSTSATPTPSRVARASNAGPARPRAGMHGGSRGKAPIRAKVLIVDARTGAAPTNLMAENCDGRTLTRQVTREKGRADRRAGLGLIAAGDRSLSRRPGQTHSKGTIRRDRPAQAAGQQGRSPGCAGVRGGARARRRAARLSQEGIGRRAWLSAVRGEVERGGEGDQLEAGHGWPARSGCRVAALAQ